MAAGDDIALRILADVSDARRNIEFLRVAFLNAVRLMEEAARRPDFDPLSAEALRLDATVQALGAQFVAAFNKADKEIHQAGRALRVARGEVNRLDQTMAKLRRSGGGQLIGVLTDIRNVLGGVGIALGGQQITQAIRSFATGLGNVIGQTQKTRIQLEALRAQLNAAAGSVRAGGDAYEFAKRKALELGFGLNDVVQAQARFEAATRQSNLTLIERRSIFESVIDAARVLQLSQQRVNNAFLALEQIASKGRVSMEELRRQLGDQIPGALPILATELGITTGELIKMVEAGKLMADEALPALDRGLRRTFGPGLKESIETDAAAIARLRTQVVLLKDEFAKGLAEKTSTALGGIAEGAEKSEFAIYLAGAALGDFVDHLLKAPLRKTQEGLGLLVAVLNQFGLEEIAAAAAVKALNDAQLQFLTSSGKAEEQTRRNIQALNIYAEAILRANERGDTNIETIEQTARAFSLLASKIINAGDVSAEMNAFLKRTAAEFAKAYEAAGRDVPKFLEDIGGAVETLREKLEKAAAAERKFVEELFESSGSLFKNKKGLEELTLLYLRATAGVGEFGATSADQTAKALEFALKLAQGYRDMGAAIPVDLLDKIEALARTSVEGAEKATKAIREQIDAYSALGEAVPEDLLARYERLVQITLDHERAVALSALGLKDFRDALVGNSEELAVEAEQLVRVVTAMRELGVATPEQGEIIREALQEVLDRFAEIGEQPPAHLQLLADAMGVTTTRIAEEVEKQQKLLGDLLKAFEAIKTAAPGGEAAKDLATQRKELEALETKQKEQGSLTAEEVERIGQLSTSIDRLSQEVEGLGTAYDQMGDQAVASADQVKDAINGLIRGNAEAFATLPLATQEAVDLILDGLRRTAEDGLATEEVITDAFLKISDRMEEGGADVGAFQEQLGLAGDEALTVADAVDALGKGTEGAASAMGDLGDATEEAKDKQEEQVEAVEKLKAAHEDLGKTMEATYAAMKQHLQEAVALQAQLVTGCADLKACMAGTG
jgi:tape measure domain-containing protein